MDKDEARKLLDEDARYRRNRQAVLDCAVGPVQEPMVLFYQANQSWGPDALTATVKHPDGPHFFVVGRYTVFPGWGGHLTTPVEDWDELREEVVRWVETANKAAQEVKGMPDPSSHPQEGVRWIHWQEKVGAFSRPFTRGGLLEPPIPLAPDEAVLYYEILERHARSQQLLQEQLQRVLEEEKDAEEALQRAQERLTHAKLRKTKLMESMGP